MRALFERPCTLQRFPDGVEGEAIYQKRVPEHHPEWLETARVTFPSGRHADELCVTEVAAVAWAANLGTIVFHPWPSRRADTEHPDELRIDLDPQPGTDFDDARSVAVAVHELLDEVGYVGYPEDVGRSRASTSTCDCSRGGRSPRFAARCWRSRARSSGAFPSK